MNKPITSVVFAHPDDEVISFLPAIADAVDRGNQINLIHCIDCGSERDEKAKESLKVLKAMFKCKDMHLLKLDSGVADEEAGNEPSIDNCKKLLRAIEKDPKVSFTLENSERVYTHCPVTGDYGSHPQHREVASAMEGYVGIEESCLFKVYHHGQTQDVVTHVTDSMHLAFYHLDGLVKVYREDFAHLDPAVYPIKTVQSYYTGKLVSSNDYLTVGADPEHIDGLLANSVAVVYTKENFWEEVQDTNGLLSSHDCLVNDVIDQPTKEMLSEYYTLQKLEDSKVERYLGDTYRISLPLWSLTYKGEA